MNIVFAVQDSREALALKNELARLIAAAKASGSPDKNNVPVDLRHVTVERAGVLQDGRVELPDNGLFPGDVILIDAALTGDRTQKAIEDAVRRVPGVPVIVLTDPKDDSLAAGALTAGAVDCMAKTDNYLVKLVAIIERESRYQALKREKIETLAREKRIRLIIESLPAGIAVIAPDGTFLAVNLAGLKLLGFEKLEQAVGKNALDFANGENLEKLQGLLEKIADGKNASVNLDWENADGTALCIRMDATPMQKQGIQGSAVLAAIHSLEDDAENPDIQKILQESEKKLQELEENHALQQTRWEEAIRHEEGLRREIEERQAEVQGRLSSLKKALDDSEENRDRLVKILNTERSKWNQVIQDHEAALRDAEKQRAALEARIREAEETRRVEAEELQAERSAWEQTQRQLERQIREMEEKQADVQASLVEAGSQLSAIEAALTEAEENRKRQAGEYEAARSEWEELRHTLEQKADEAEGSRASLESARKAAEERIADLESRLENVEETRTALETRLSEADRERADLQAKIKESEQLQALLPAEEQLRSDLERKLAEIEEQKAAIRSDLLRSEEAKKSLETALKETEESRNRQAENYDRERSGWEEMRLALEQKVRASQEQRASLESARKAAEDRNADLEAELKDMRETRTALETRLRESGENRTRTDEILDEERSKWEELRLQQEQEICRLQEREKEVQITLQEAGSQLSDIEAALRESEENLRRQTEEFEAERSGWEQLRLSLERTAREAQEQGASRESAAKAAEERNADLEAKLRDAKEIQTSLETRFLEAEESRRKTDEILNEERSRSEQLRLQLEQEIRRLRDKKEEIRTALQEANNRLPETEAALQESEENLKRQTEQFEAERSGWEQLRQTLEQKVREAQEHESSLESARQAAEEKNAGLQARLRDEQETREAMETRFKEADEDRAALKIKLEKLEEARRAEVEDLKRKLSEREQANLALERKMREKEDERVSLRSELQISEEGQSALEAALRQVEEEQKNLLAQHEAESGHLEQMKQEWQNRLRQSEEQHAAHLQNVLKSEEDRYRRLFEDHQANKSYVKGIQRQIADLSADLKRLQSELLEARNRYRRLSETHGTAVAVTTLEGRVTECNDVAARVFGYADAGNALSAAEEKDAFHIYAFQGALGTRLQQEGLLENVEWSLLNREGRMYRLRENVKLTRDSSGETTLMERIFSDITEEHRLSEEIRRVRKADPSGDAFSSAVKILKNLNESLVRYGKTLKSAAEDPAAVQKMAKALESDAGRSSKYISQLIAVSSKADRISTIFDLNEILEENDEVLRNLAGDAVDLQIELMPGGSLIAADRGEMVQLILSAVVTSLKSLHLGGSVSIRTENVEMEADASEKNPSENRSGLYVQLTVSADGCEMTPDGMPAFNQAMVDRLGGWSESSIDPQSGQVHKIYLPRVVAASGEKALPKGMIEIRLTNRASSKSA